MLPKTVCGSTPGQFKIHSPSEDSSAAFFEKNRPDFLALDTIGIPKRITYLKEDGLFLNERQEQVTLEKLLWKEQYRQDAVSMYWVNQALEERIDEVLAKNQRLERDLRKAEVDAATAVSNMEHYKGLYEVHTAENTKLTKENSNLKIGNFIWKTTTITFAATSIYLGTKLLFFR